MLDGKLLKKTLISSITLMSGLLFLQSPALATSCTTTISGTAFSGVICDFNTGNSVTVANGGEVGGISQSGYTPSSSFITNNGTISNDTVAGINIDASSLSNGLTNNGVITVTTSESGIVINNSSTISGDVSNSGSITSGEIFGFQLDNSSTINGNISNSGTIISNGINNPALVIRTNSTVTGNITNSGTIRAYGDGDGIYMNDSGSIHGNITNSGTIRGGNAGIDIRVTSSVHGNITNSGIITGDASEGILITQGGELQGSIINSATISGNNNGISADNFGTISGSIINQAGATISGSNGIYINDLSTVSGSIDNYGTITGSTNAIYINADSTVNSINTYDGSIINGAINAINTTVNITGGEFNGTMNVNAVNIISGGVFTMDNTITVQNAVTNAGTLVLDATAQTINGNYTQSTGGILQIGVQDITTYGQLTATGTVDLSQSGKIDVNIKNGANVVIGNTFSNVMSGATLTAPTGGFSVTDNSRLLNFTAALNGGTTGVNLTAADDTNTSVSQSNSAMGNIGGNGAAAKLDEIIALNPSGDWQTVIGALNRMSNDQEITNAVKQTTPVLAGATNNAMIETINTALRIVQDRQQSNSGPSAGEDFKTNRNLWIKTFGSWGNQSNKDGVVGYDSDAYGLITGVDKAITDKASLGVGMSYFNSKLTSNDNTNRVNVDSFLGILYGNYSLDDKTEVTAQVAAGYNSNHSNRNINFGGLNRVAKGRYDGWDFHTGTGISRLVNVRNDTSITPQFRLDYFNVGNQSYTESGAGVLNLSVASQVQAQLIPALEVKADHKFNPKFLLTLNTGLGYDLLHDRNSVSASFMDGGDEFITRGLEPSPWIVRSGFGLSWKQSDTLDLTARYDRRDRGTYNNQTVSLKLRVMF